MQQPHAKSNVEEIGIDSKDSNRPRSEICIHGRAGYQSQLHSIEDGGNHNAVKVKEVGCNSTEESKMLLIHRF